MRRRGVVLVAVLMLAMLAGMVAAGLVFRMQAALSASAAVGNGEQAYAAALSGIERAIAVLDIRAAEAEEGVEFDYIGIGTSSWYDNPDLFRNQVVCDDGTSRWYFTVYAPNPIDRTHVRYGLIDEAGKIDLNSADAQTLRALPNMTDELADCLADYRDRDSETRRQGAEQDYYGQLPFPYLIRNGPLATLEELLLIKGFNGSVVFGEDFNLNGILDENEDDGEESFPPDDADGRLDLGLRGLAAVSLPAPSVDSQGRPRIDINGKGKRLEEIGLSAQTLRFIKIYLGEGNKFSHPSELLEMNYVLKKDHDLGKDGKGEKGQRIESTVGAEELPIVCDRLTANPAEGGQAGRTGRIRLNVNTASAEALAVLPGIDETRARTIVSLRSSLSSETKATIAWLYTQNVLDAESFKAVAASLAARGYQYRVQSIGFGVPCGRFRVIEAVIDISRSAPRIIYLRDITRLGLPFALEVETQETAQR